MANYIEQNMVSIGGHIDEEVVPTREEINKECGETATRLMFEVRKCNKKNVVLVLEQGADVNAKDKKGVCALIMVVEIIRHNIDIAKILLDHGANINNICLEKWSPLMHASVEGDPIMVELFLDHGAEINHACNNNITSIMLASFHGKKVAVQLLASKGADISILDNDGNTAIMSATQNGHFETVEVLERWYATMAIIVLQELHCYNLFDMSYLNDLIEFLGYECDYIDI